MPSRKRVVIVGGGIAGLACAIDLARHDCDVSVVERASEVGGKIRAVDVGGQRIDSGPTVFTMKWVFDALFRDAGLDFDDYVSVSPLKVLARHAWSDHEQMDLRADLNETLGEISSFSGAEEARRYAEFCQTSQHKFQVLRDTFLTASRPNPLSLAWRIGLHRPLDLLALRPFSTLWSDLSRHFTDPRLIQLFGRYATYVGSSPFSAPATLALIAHVEQEGVWTVDGGMRQLPKALAEAATALGANVKVSAEVTRITAKNGAVTGVEVDSGERYTADAVIFNGDPSAVAQGLLGPSVVEAVKPTRASHRSLSALTWSMTASTQGFPLVRHNVFFGPDYHAEFEDLMTYRELNSRPTIYVCAQDRDDTATSRSDQSERLFVLVNAPANGNLGSRGRADLEQYGSLIFARLRDCGLKVDVDPEHVIVTEPSDFHRLFPGSSGALYGEVTHGWASSFGRTTSRTKTKGLYLAGGATHPGAGVPMATLSGRLAAQTVLTDLHLTRM